MTGKVSERNERKSTRESGVGGGKRREGTSGKKEREKKKGKREGKERLIIKTEIGIERGGEGKK